MLAREESLRLDVLLGVLLGAALTVSALAVARLAAAPRRMLDPGDEAMRTALHAAAATLPHLRRGLTEATAARAAPHLRALTGAAAVALADEERVLAVDGDAGGGLRAGAPLPRVLRQADGARGRVRVEQRLEEGRSAVVAPLTVQGEPVGALVAVYEPGRELRPEDARVVAETASLVAAQVELSAVAAQGERVAQAELRALRAQISPHFIYNALAAVANLIHTRPEEARELLADFADFTRYAFRGERPHVTLADELRYVEIYLRLEQARFGDRLQVRVEVDPAVLSAVVPVLSLQPLVENAVRHGVESREGTGHVDILGRDLGPDVELRVSDDGAGIAPEHVAGVLRGRPGHGIGVSNVHGRLQATFGPPYGLQIESPARGTGTVVVMSVPKFHAGVRAA
jgi:two-component system, LytTR family, sensor kinase